MPREKLQATGIKTLQNGEEKLLYTITSNMDNTMFYLNDATGRRLHKADNPLKFDATIRRIFR